MIKKQSTKKAISLITLVITVVVMMILASAVILSINNSGTISNAKEASFKTTLRTLQDELALYISNEIIENNGVYNESQLYASSKSSPSIKEIIPSIGGYEEKFQIIAGELAYVGENLNEQKYAKEMGYLTSVEASGANAPNLLDGMIAVYYDEADGVWKKADSKNQNEDYLWYNYNADKKMWANVVTVTADTRQKYQDLALGEEILMDDINTMFVWIPRYAYSIQGGAYKTVTSNATGKIDVKFLIEDRNIDINGVTYEKDYDASKLSAGDDTPYIVHPAFNFDGEELEGIWVAKFEASKDADTGYMEIIPGVSSWRSITVSNIFDECLKLDGANSSIYGFTNSNSHMMKNTEWGAVAYLCASSYGVIPQINSSNGFITGAGKNPNGSENQYTYSGETGYNTEIGKASSTTGNVYGIYDMSGGASEYVATYLNNGNSNLNTYGKSLVQAEDKYKDIYEVSEEEKNNLIENTVAGSGTLTQQELSDYTYNSIRIRLTKKTYENMASKKGDAMYEVIADGNYSYYGKNTSNNATWMKDETTSGGFTNWNSDISYIGNSQVPFVLRGGLGYVGEEVCGSCSVRCPVRGSSSF